MRVAEPATLAGFDKSTILIHNQNWQIRQVHEEIRMTRKGNDGFVAIAHDSVTRMVKLSTVIPVSKAHTITLGRCYALAPEYGFGSKASEISINPDADGLDVVLSAEFPIHMTGQSKHEIRRDFVGLLRASGIMSNPMMCLIGVPVCGHRFK